MEEAIWQFDGLSARFEIDDLSGDLLLHDPNRGLTNLSAGGERIERLSLFQVANLESRPPTECVPRGGDLIVRYPSTNDWPVTTEVYWRVTVGRSVPTIDFIISVETDRLDTAPEVILRTCAGGHVDVQQHAEGLTLVSTPTASTNLALMTLPAEYAHQTEIIAADNDSPVTVESRLQFNPLEKGVIRRARMRAAFLPSEDAAATANTRTLGAKYFAEFAASALPLTV
jgi:hypothetical protein